MIDELLAKLEPSTIRLGMGRGGVPELTAIDIDGALGMIEDKFAGAMFVLIGAGEIHNWKLADELIAKRQYEEWRERADRLVMAQIAKARADRLKGADRVVAEQHANRLIEGAKAAMWPGLIESKYAEIRRCVVSEIRAPRTCHKCNGHAEIIVLTSIVPCPNCIGTGKVKISDRQRAHSIHVANSNYQRTWRRVYEWTYRLVMDAAATGRYEFTKALGRAA